MPVILQSTVGGFDRDFLHQLPALEQAMETRGIDPSRFIIAKNAAQFPVPYSNLSPGVSGQFDYTVFVDGESFTVTMHSDMSFLAYFKRLCMAPDIQGGHKGLFDRIKGWLKAEPDFLKGDSDS